MMSSLARLLVSVAFLFALASGGSLGETAQEGQKAEKQTGPTAQRFIQEGIAVELALGSLRKGKEGPAELLEGEEVTVRFRVSDSPTGTALTGLHPGAWIDLRRGDASSGVQECQQKVQSFLQGSLSARPVIDLNTYYVLALNREPNISVIDPLLGFGRSNLYALVPLKGPGEDWVLSGDRQRLFVSLPSANQVAVVDTAAWKVTAYIDAGTKPTRLALQPDGKYLWVGNHGDGVADSASGVTVIEADTLKVAARIPTGAGHHEIAFGADDRHAFVTNREAGTVSVLDVQKLAKVKDLPTGRLPSALAFSPLSRAVYVVQEGDGSILVLDGRRLEISARLEVRPGLRASTR